jgi:hypothetical protein
MSRIQTIEPQRANLFTRIVYWAAKRKVGKLTDAARLVEPLKVNAHQPRLLFGYGQMELALDAMSTVPAHLKSLASLKAATLIGCPY